ncbi:MAG: STAS domain-containing protein [Candidatus Mcinerneyibacterium aminivorans]|uniref:Anti-sigma factor antagonist n=1 Tax=Candidatus Mcinerneyibacterium aminivorans TaxID=2703815 RepID=A0A5D0MHP3_9BACT|nr:MAG: STAS domain-containing protein [Candidatus Mcinerneyibacterium aminivorans]
MDYNIKYDNSKRVAVVKFEGALDVNNKNEVIKMIKNELLPKGWKYVLFVVSNLNYIDSSGLGVLLSARSILNKKGGDLALVNKNKKLTKILNLAGFNKMFKIYGKIEEGKKKVKL